MACLWRREQNGIWCITYQEQGKQRVRSLRTRNKRGAVRFQREIESILDQKKIADVSIVEKPKSEEKNPTVEEFWPAFLNWANEHRACATVDEYKNWFPRFREFTGMEHLGDTSEDDAEAFKLRLLTQGTNRHKNGIEKVSINSALKTLTSIWNHARKLGFYTGANPFVKVERFSLPQKPDRHYLDSGEIDGLLEAAQRYADEKYVRMIEARNVYLSLHTMVSMDL